MSGRLGRAVPRSTSRTRCRSNCTDFTPTTGYTSSMTVLPFTDARNRLSELIDEVARTHERVEITRHGHAVAVLISPDDLAALEETLDGPAPMPCGNSPSPVRPSNPVTSLTAMSSRR